MGLRSAGAKASGIATGTTYNSHIDYDALKGSNDSPGMFVRQNRLVLSFPFCSRSASASTGYQRKPKSLPKKKKRVRDKIQENTHIPKL